MPCNWPATRPPRWWTGTTITRTTTTSASCSTAATGRRSFLPDIKIANAPILGSTLGVENTYGALDGRTPAGPLTYGRITTADADGSIRCYVGEGELTNDELDDLRQPRAVAHVPKLQKLMRYVCQKGFEHHVVMTHSHSAAILAEALGQLPRLGSVSPRKARLKDPNTKLQHPGTPRLKQNSISERSLD